MSTISIKKREAIMSEITDINGFFHKPSKSIIVVDTESNDPPAIFKFFETSLGLVSSDGNLCVPAPRKSKYTVTEWVNYLHNSERTEVFNMSPSKNKFNPDSLIEKNW